MLAQLMKGTICRGHPQPVRAAFISLQASLSQMGAGADLLEQGSLPAVSAKLGRVEISSSRRGLALPLPWRPMHFQNDADPVSEQQTFLVVVAIDFGTTSSGYAYSFTKEPECIHVMR